MNIPVTVLDDMSQVPGITVPSAYLQNILDNRKEYNQSLLSRARVAGMRSMTTTAKLDEYEQPPTL